MQVITKLLTISKVKSLSTCQPTGELALVTCQAPGELPLPTCW